MLRKIDGTYYWIETRTTCLCDRMYCAGCEEIELSRVPIPVTDCEQCAGKSTVIPVATEIGYKPYHRHDYYKLQCSVCKHVKGASNA